MRRLIAAILLVPLLACGWTVVKSRSPQLRVAAATGTSTNLVVSYTPTTLRNNYTGNLGMLWTNGASSISVTALGRWILDGNSNSHAIRVVRWSDKTVIATATISTVGQTTNTFAYTNISAVTLAANTAYAIVSAETSGADRWYERKDTAPAMEFSYGAYGNLAVYATNTTDFSIVGNSTRPYVPVSFMYLPP